MWLQELWRHRISSCRARLKPKGCCVMVQDCKVRLNSNKVEFLGPSCHQGAGASLQGPSSQSLIDFGRASPWRRQISRYVQRDHSSWFRNGCFQQSATASREHTTAGSCSGVVPVQTARVEANTSRPATLGASDKTASNSLMQCSSD